MRHADETGKMMASARPLLKWAGGKRQLLPALRRFIPSRFGAYYEPFAGSAALFFDLWEAGTLKEKRATLVDSNADLIGCYRAVAQDVDGVIGTLCDLAAAHARDPRTTFYAVRDELFNPGRRSLVNETERHYPTELAAMFIYLNRTGFNGLYRLNSKGDFNVPLGRYARPQICDERILRAASSAFSASTVALRQDGYEAVRDLAQPDDVVYFDPPYAPLNTTARFVSYTASGFSEDDQKRLQTLAVDLARRGCHVVLSNSTAPLIAQLYDNNVAARRAGLQTYKVPARRSINSDPSRRGEIDEYIITNVELSAR